MQTGSQEQQEGLFLRKNLVTKGRYLLMSFRVQRERLRVKDARVFTLRHILDKVNALRFVAKVEDYHYLVSVFCARIAIEYIIATCFYFFEGPTKFPVP